MIRRSLVEYTLSPEELQQAVLEYCARNAPADVAGKLRYVLIKFDHEKKRKPGAVALVELPDEGTPP